MAPPQTRLPLVISSLLALCACALLSCGEDPASRDDTNGDVVQPADDDGQIEVPGCERVESVVEVGALPGAPYDPVAEPRVSDEQVVWQRRHTELSNSPNDSEIFSFDPRTEETDQLTANDSDERLLDAGYGATLFMATDPVDYSYHIMLDRAGQQTLLAEGVPRPINLFEASHGRWLSEEAAVWLLADEPDRGYDNGLYLYDGAQTIRVSGSVLNNRSPDLEGLDVVWEASDGEDFEIAYSSFGQRAGGGDTFELLTANNRQDSAPLLSEGRVFWLSERAPATIDLASRDTVVIDDRDCLRHGAGAGFGVFACGEIGAPPVVYPNETELIALDGQGERVLFSDRGPIHDIAVQGRSLAWVEYPLDAEFYGGEVGVIYYVADVTRDQEPVEVAPIGSGCLWCDAYWPAATVRLGDEVLAWNYAVTEEQVEDQPVTYPEQFSIGYAVLQPSLVCGQ